MAKNLRGSFDFVVGYSRGCDFLVVPSVEGSVSLGHTFPPRPEPYPTFSCPIIRRCTSSTFSAAGTQSTTVPFSNWLEASFSPPRRTIISLSRLQWFVSSRSSRQISTHEPNFEETRAGPAGHTCKRIETGHFSGSSHRWRILPRVLIFCVRNRFALGGALGRGWRIRKGQLRRLINFNTVSNGEWNDGFCRSKRWARERVGVFQT